MRHEQNEIRANQKIYYSSIKERRGDYLIEYQPPNPGYRFASLSLTYLKDVQLLRVALDMEKEANLWLSRFPIPLMISAFDNCGDLIDLNGIRTDKHLIAFHSQNAETIEYHWNLVNDEQIPAVALDQNYLQFVYAEIDSKSSAELEKEAKRQIGKIRIGYMIIFIWAVIVPAAALIIEYFIPQWLAKIILVFGLGKAAYKAASMFGLLKKSPRVIAQEEKNRRMQHYYYHCEKNPDGFSRLKMENLKKESRDQIQKEANNV